ncbi:MAG: Peptidoglycan-binding lysin protein [Anaerocolumna sp.]|jgi:nucleoid-associated protein YgaU|nr:Peptidoglycan-binding lysin protein [Anaerocolumna sp.]
MYAVFFDYNGTTFRLPTNPEEIKFTTSQANSKYEVLKLGQIVIPTHMELMEYSFECELPLKIQSYVLNQNEFKTANEYLVLFRKWREKMVPIRFMAGRINSSDKLIGNHINKLVLIEELTITERAGEEGDKYVSFKLKEYRKFGKYIGKEIDKKTGNEIKGKNQGSNPKNTGTHVVVSGDNLWNLAKKYYGDGSKYTKIYNGNKDKLKSPSLIYPGQKLVIP